MSIVYVPHGADEGDAPPDGERVEQRTVGWTEHHSCGLGGFVLAVAVSALLYPVLVALTESFGVLSTTVLVSTVVVLWALGWIGLELLWERRAGRWQTARDR